MIEAATVILLVLHSVNGTEITVNAGKITSMREAREDDSNDKLTTKGVRCIVWLTDGHFASVTEECSDVRKQVERRVEERLDKIEGKEKP